MISVLIPVFNNDVTGLVHALEGEVQTLNFPAEIILLDDGSDEHYRRQNRLLAVLPHVRYEEGTQNLGRSLVRPKLASLAGYDWLLFLDGDSSPVQPRFLQAYADAIRGEEAVFAGGRIYPEEPPSGCRYRLHWTYGREREYGGKSAAASPYRGGFQTNNFLIRKELFQQLLPVPPLTGYGHEDTWMGIRLHQLGVRITYLYNPVLHAGLETTERFLLKTENALQNLLLLEGITGPELLSEHVTLYRVYAKLHSWRLYRLYAILFRPFHGRVYRNLLSCRPSLFLFDLYRLDSLLRLERTISSSR